MTNELGQAADAIAPAAYPQGKRLQVKKPPQWWLFGVLRVPVLFLYFQRSKLGGVIWQVFPVGS
jgi:hypothetical protein